MVRSQPTDLRSSFLDSPRGAIHIVEHVPLSGRDAGDVLFVPPFGEEMNRTRRASTLMSRELAARGHRGVLMDFHGTGDSDGDLVDAALDDWVEDVTAVRNWITRSGRSLVAVVAIRLGALIALAEMANNGSVPRVVLWQPVVDGGAHLREIFRQAIISERLRGRDSGEDVDALCRRSSRGDSVEVGGYLITAKLAASISKLNILSTQISPATLIHWLEISTAAFKPEGDARESLRRQGHSVEFVACSGPMFWAMTDPPVPTRLIDESLRLFS